MGRLEPRHRRDGGSLARPGWQQLPGQPGALPSGVAQAGTLRGRLFESPALAEVARRHGATVPQVVLAWDVRGGDTIAIPRSSRPEHTLENAAADAIELTEEDLALISRDFPAPSHKMPLDME
ncbi:aldo/keto reductase [Candidatus Collinsella stercoripullorum]|uniref:aldo/keto reductase n=1 Tax=Candidatus Collinsella stercoripullorum TaxID=2838522 RepID=UPI001C3B63CB|nr:aldo/keto reductase [Candidatus Collinsella stercoripullorum]HJA00280.1 aldo/keto reductase [Candidatus Collinsella stercoripullorum]